MFTFYIIKYLDNKIFIQVRYLDLYWELIKFSITIRNLILWDIFESGGCLISKINYEFVLTIINLFLPQHLKCQIGEKNWKTFSKLGMLPKNFGHYQWMILTLLTPMTSRGQEPYRRAASITSLHLTQSKASRCQSATPKAKASLLTPSIHLIRGLLKGRDVLMFSWNTSDMVRSRGALTTCPTHCNLSEWFEL